jgi:hypothetical protein
VTSPPSIFSTILEALLMPSNFSFNLVSLNCLVALLASIKLFTKLSSITTPKFLTASIPFLIESLLVKSIALNNDCAPSLTSALLIPFKTLAKLLKISFIP